MKVKTKIAELYIKVISKVAEKTVNEPSKCGYHQPKEPEAIVKLKK